MSTPNFYTNNARAIYAINNTSFCNIIDNVRFAAGEEWEEIDEHIEDCRSYPIHYITKREYNITFGNETFYIIARIGYRYGYYDGGNIDFELSLFDDYCFEPCNVKNCDIISAVEEFINDKYQFRDYCWSAGLASILRPKLKKKLISFMNSVATDCENICELSSDNKLACIGVFSNGEAIYRTIN